MRRDVAERILARSTACPWVELICFGALLLLAACGGGKSQRCHFEPSTASYYPKPRGADAVVLGDMDGDGKLDVVVGRNATPSATSVLLNRKDGTLAAYQPFPSEPCYVPPLLVDLDDDGRLDVILGATGAVQVLLNQGGGKLGSARRYELGEGSGPRLLAPSRRGTLTATDTPTPWSA